MIFSLNYSAAFFIILLLPLAGMTFLWWRDLKRTKEEERQGKCKLVFHCDKCHLTFLPTDEVNLTRCPRCNNICIRRQR